MQDFGKEQVESEESKAGGHVKQINYLISDQEFVLKITQYLKRKRQEAGLTQKAVSSRFGFSSPQFVSNWERGLALPPIYVMRELIELYKLDNEEFYQLLSGEMCRVLRKDLLLD